MRSARFWTLLILSNSWSDRDECHTGQQYSRTDLITAKRTRKSSRDGTPLRLSTRGMWSLLEPLLTTSLTWRSHLRLLWIVTPKTLLRKPCCLQSELMGGVPRGDGKQTATSLSFLGFSAMLFFAVNNKLRPAWFARWNPRALEQSLR